MKLIIAGGRDLVASIYEIQMLLNHHKVVPTEIVSGGANGIDSCGEVYAFSRSIPVKKFPANWKKHGKAAGPLRNTEMAKYADALLLIWDGKSRGSASMKSLMKATGKPIYEAVIS
jgi:YspA, cpYpsA-related SLOG family